MQCQAAFLTSTGYDHFGNDLPGNPVAAPSASACQAICFTDTICNAYTYIGSEAGKQEHVGLHLTLFSGKDSIASLLCDHGVLLLPVI